MTDSTFDEYQTAVVAQWVEAEKKRKEEPITEPAIELACPSCRGTLHVYESAPPKELVKGPRQSKNRRIRKKQLKRWKKEIAPILAFHSFHSGLRPPNYVCAACKRSVGFYQAIGHNLIQVEPMPVPKGASVFYFDSPLPIVEPATSGDDK